MNRTTLLAESPGLLGLYRAFWQYAEGARIQVVGSSALLIGSQLARLTLPWLTAQAINAVQVSGADSTRNAAVLILLILLATVVSWMMHGPGRVIERSIAVRVRKQLADQNLRKLRDACTTPQSASSPSDAFPKHKPQHKKDCAECQR